MKIKKSIAMLSSFSITAILSTSVVSCVSPKYASGIDGQRVVLVTDGGRIDDRSFNQDSFLGVEQYIKNEYGLSAKSNYVEPADFSTPAKISGYKMAAIKKADAIVLPGFSHLDAIQAAKGYFEDKTIVLADASVDYENNQNKNIISIAYDSQFAGIQAGFDASYWATRSFNGKLQGDISGDGKIRIGTFAGASNKFGVDNYLWGLFIGIQLYNEIIAKNDPQNNPEVLFGNSGSGKLEDVNVLSPGDSHFYSGSFALGDATKSGVLNYIVNTNQSDIIFPVAGAQISDALSYQSKGRNSYQPYIIGVDVDQANSFPNESKKGRFVTSAIKNLHDSVAMSLKKARSLIDKDGLEHKEVWDGTKAVVQKNWSTDLTNGLNRLGAHKFILFDGQNDENSPNGNTPITENDLLMKKINEIFADTPNDVSDYLNGKNILNIVYDLKKVIEDIGIDKVIDKDINEENINNKDFN